MSCTRECIEERLVSKINEEFDKIQKDVEHHPFIQEDICYGNGDNDKELNYMSYTRPIFTMEDGTYLVLMVVEWKKTDDLVKTAYLWNGKIYNLFVDLKNALQEQYSRFKNVIDFS